MGLSELLASGAYKCGSRAPGLDVESTLRAGHGGLLQRRAQATVSVKRLTGVLADGDGKVDASTGGDMRTQKLLAMCHCCCMAQRSESPS